MSFHAIIRTSNPIDKFRSLPLTLAFISLSILSALLYISRLGINITDEGFALLAIHYPYSFHLLFTYFGQIVSPIYLLLGQDVVALRQFHVVFVFIASSFLIYSGLRTSKEYSWIPWRTLKWRSLLIRSRFLYSIGFGYIGFLGMWPFLTPSYGSICFDALLIFSFPVVLNIFDRRPGAFYCASLVVCGLSLYVILMSKITTGLLLVMLFTAYSFVRITRRFLPFLAIILIGFGLYLFSGVSNYGSVDGFYNSLLETSEVMAFFASAHYTTLGLISALVPSTLFLATSLIVCLAFFLFRIAWQHNYFHSIVFTLSFCAFIFLIYVISFYWSFGVRPERLSESFLSSLFFIFAVSGLISYVMRSYSLRVHHINKGHRPPLLFLSHIPYLLVNDESFSAILFLGFLPFVMAFGTSNSLYEYASHGVIFFFVAGLLSFPNRVDLMAKPTSEIPSVFGLILISFPTLVLIGVIDIFLGRPYARNSPFIADHSNQVHQISRLRIDQQTQDLLSPLVKVKNDAPRSSPLTLIDLTSFSPGLVYLSNFKPLGWPWILGSTSGTTEVAKRVLERVPQELTSCAYIMTSSRSGFIDHDAVLKHLSIDLDDPRSYTLLTNYRRMLPGNKLESFDISIYRPLRNGCLG